MSMAFLVSEFVFDVPVAADDELAALKELAAECPVGCAAGAAAGV